MTVEYNRFSARATCDRGCTDIRWNGYSSAGLKEDMQSPDTFYIYQAQGI